MMKIYEKIVTSIDYEEMDMKMDLEVDLSMMLSNHNEPVNIELPEEAENAVSYNDMLYSIYSS